MDLLAEDLARLAARPQRLLTVPPQADVPYPATPVRAARPSAAARSWRVLLRLRRPAIVPRGA